MSSATFRVPCRCAILKSIYRYPALSTASFGFTAINRFSSANPKQPTNLKGRSTTAQKWLIRQLKDPYVIQSKLADYRSRSAFKLIEIDDKYRFLHPGSRVVDCGAAPGGWTQVTVERINALGQDKHSATGRVVAVDKNHVLPIDGAFVLTRDLTKVETANEILAYFESADSSFLDVVLSDMAPSTSGQPDCDHERIIELSYQALLFAARHLKKGGYFLTKLWDGKSRSKLMNDMKKLFENVSIVKPEASRDDSAEIFLIGREFKGLKRSA